MPHPRAADTAPGRETDPPSSGPEAAWVQPVPRRLLNLGRRLRWLDRQRPWLLDATVVLLFSAACLPDLLHGGKASATGTGGDHRAQWPALVPYLLYAALIVPLWWRRRAPATVFWTVTAAFLVQVALGIGLAAGLSQIIALYNVARHSTLRTLGLATAAAAGCSALETYTLTAPDTRLIALYFFLALVTLAAVSGLTVRIRRMYLTELEDRARRLEIERDQRAKLTAAAERARIAREMHDIVGHNLAVMVTLADGAATLAARDGENSAEALRMLGDAGRQALGELRRVLDVLREQRGDADSSLSPQPRIGDIDALLARVRAAGLPVTYRTTGDLAELADGLQLAVYRIVQEALTNALKHAGTATTAEVIVTAEADTVRVRVTDTGTPADTPGPTAATGAPGHGLVGIRERASLYGGTATIGPREDQPGWVVDAQLDATAAPSQHNAENDPS